MSGRWLSRAAVLWALYEAENVPAHLVSTLIAIAASTGTDGKGAYISAATVAQLTRKTERNAKKDLAELVRLGLLVPGNPRIVAHIRSDRRPNVYDVPMPRGDAHDTPSGGNGVMHTTARGVAQGPDGVSHTTPEEILNRSRISARDASGDDTPHAHQENPAETAAEHIECASQRAQEREHREDPPPAADSIAQVRALLAASRKRP